MNDRLYRWICFVPLLLLLAVVVLNCSVERKSAPQTLAGQGTTLPAGLYLSDKKNFLVKMMPEMLEPNADNDVTFTIVSTDFAPALRNRALVVETDYFMPKMEMDITPAVKKDLDESKIQFTYEIAHGGLWHLVLKIKRGEETVDTVLIALDVPQT